MDTDARGLSMWMLQGEDYEDYIETTFKHGIVGGIRHEVTMSATPPERYAPM